MYGMRRKPTDLVELEDVGLCAGLAEQALGGLAVRAVGLGEDGCAGWTVSDATRVPRRAVPTHQRRCCR